MGSHTRLALGMVAGIAFCAVSALHPFLAPDAQAQEPVAPRGQGVGQSSVPGPGADPDAPSTAEPLVVHQDVTFNLNAKAAYLTPPIRGGTTPFDMGYGGALGITVSGVYVGASVIYFLGGRDVTISDHSLFYGLELGYAVNLASLGRGHLTLRPQVGAGGVSIYHTDPSTAKVDVVSTASGSRSSSSSDTTSVSTFYVAPQVTLMYTDERFLVGATGTTMVLPSVSYSGAAATTWVSYGGEAIAGLRF